MKRKKVTLKHPEDWRLIQPGQAETYELIVNSDGDRHTGLEDSDIYRARRVEARGPEKSCYLAREPAGYWAFLPDDSRKLQTLPRPDFPPHVFLPGGYLVIREPDERLQPFRIATVEDLAEA